MARQLAYLLEAGWMAQPVRGVYVDARLAHDLAVRARCVAQVLPAGAVVARLTAAWLRGVDARSPAELATPMPVECLVPRAVQPLRRPGVRCYTAEVEHDVESVAGVLATSAERTAVDLLRWRPPHLALGAVDAMAGAGLIGVEQVVHAVERWSGHRGVGQARRLAGLVEPRAESQPESWLRLRIVDAGFPRPTVQIEVLDRSGRLVYRLDLGWEALLIGIEYDGEDDHGSVAAQEHDRARRERLEREFGWRAVVGVGRGEVLGRSMALEWGIGELLGMEPCIRRRAW